MSSSTPQTPQPQLPGFKPEILGDLIVDHAGEFVVLLHPTQPRWALTDEAGLAMARKFDGELTTFEIASEIASASVVEPELVFADLQDFVTRLYESNLLKNAPLPKRASTKPAKQPSMTIYITEQCNLRCKHCAVVEGAMPQTTLTAPDIMKLVDEHLANHPGATIAFLGGEPLMHPECLPMVEYACERTGTVNIGTNGLYIDDAVAERLAKSGANVQISLDGADPEVHDFIRGKGTFTKAWNAIELFCAHGGAPRLMIATVLTRSVLDQVKALIRRCDELEIWKVRFLPLNKIKAAITNWDRIEPTNEEFMEITRWLIFEAPKLTRTTEVAGSFPGFVPNADPDDHHWCPLGRTFIVDSQGEIFNCPAIKDERSNIGNFRDQSLSEIEEGAKNTAAREEMLDRRYEVEECVKCAWKNFCQGGCLAYSTFRTDSLYVNDEFCGFRRALYREHVLRDAGLLQESELVNDD